MTTPSSDEKLRDLERRFRQTGSPDDEAAWLLERVRIQTLAWDQVVLAGCYCAREGARLAAVALGRARPAPPEDLRGWLAGLSEWGPIAFAGGISAAFLVAAFKPPRIGNRKHAKVLQRAAREAAICVVRRWWAPPSEIDQAAWKGLRADLNSHVLTLTSDMAHIPLEGMADQLTPEVVSYYSGQVVQAMSYTRLSESEVLSQTREELGEWALNPDALAPFFVPDDEAAP